MTMCSLHLQCLKRITLQMVVEIILCYILSCVCSTQKPCIFLQHSVFIWLDSLGNLGLEWMTWLAWFEKKKHHNALQKEQPHSQVCTVYTFFYSLLAKWCIHKKMLRHHLVCYYTWTNKQHWDITQHKALTASLNNSGLNRDWVITPGVMNKVIK